MRKKFNKYDLTSFDYGIGITSNGDEFIFDKEDYEKIKDICWYKDTTGYYRGQYPNSIRKASLHRIIMNANNTDTIDHINHNLNDNRKSNLRICTRSQNSKNSMKKKSNKSGCPGVWFDEKRNNGVSKYAAIIRGYSLADLIHMKKPLKSD